MEAAETQTKEPQTMTTQPEDIPDVQKQIAELEKAKLKALFEYTKTVAEIDERLSQLLAEGKT
jgi:cell fate (sporulation/competence/biofilm development) regulator YmcA (YheA/YmcA/DUF963 family)